MVSNTLASYDLVIWIRLFDFNIDDRQVVHILAVTSRNEDEVSLVVNRVLICSASGSFLQREDMHAQSMRVLNPPRGLPIEPFHCLA